MQNINADQLLAEAGEALAAVDPDLDLSALMSLALIAVTTARAVHIRARAVLVTEQARDELARNEALLAEAEDLLARTRQSVSEIGTPNTSMLLRMYPFGLAKGRSLAEVDEAVRRFGLDLDTRLVVTLRPEEKFPIEVQSLGSHGVVPLQAALPRASA